MLKKAFVTFVAFMSTVGVVFALNQNMEATTGPEYYGVGDNFLKTGSNVLNIGGMP